MKETLRILFSAAFLSTVFLCAYNYVNSTADDRQNSITSLWNNNSKSQDDDETSPVGDSFELDPSNSLSTKSAQNNQMHSSPFNDDNDDSDFMSLPLPAPESQLVKPSEAYGSSSTEASNNVMTSINDSPVIEPLTPDPLPNSPMDSTGSPEVFSDNEVIPLPPPTAPSNANLAAVNPTPTVNPTVNPTTTDPERAAAAAFINEAKQRIARGEIRQTLLRLSQYYNAPGFTPSETNEIHAMLMKLAGEVIYRHPEKYFKSYTVQPGDTITSIAAQHQIPWQFIAKINGIMPPYHVNPGEQVKVVQGPFNAEVHLDKYELTLWLPVGNDHNESLYAGTFPIGLGSDCPRLQGDYIIDSKYINPEYPKFSNNLTTFGPGDANNPYGNRLLSLLCVNDPNHVKIGIHGTNNEQYIRQSVPYGFICLGAHDIDDLYDILSVGSRIKIER